MLDKNMDNVKSIIRFLQSKVGEEWNKVWSEFCERVKGRQAHYVRVLARDIVDVDCWSGFYVNADGILCKKPDEPRRVRKPKCKIAVENNKATVKIKGHWYELEFAELIALKRDVFLKKMINSEIALEWYGDGKIMCVSKRAMNSMDIKKLIMKE